MWLLQILKQPERVITMETLRIISLVLLALFIIGLIACYVENTKKKDREIILIFMVLFTIPFIYIILN